MVIMCTMHNGSTVMLPLSYKQHYYGTGSSGGKTVQHPGLRVLCGVPGGSVMICFQIFIPVALSQWLLPHSIPRLEVIPPCYCMNGGYSHMVLWVWSLSDMVLWVWSLSDMVLWVWTVEHSWAEDH